MRHTRSLRSIAALSLPCALALLVFDMSAIARSAPPARRGAAIAKRAVAVDADDRPAGPFQECGLELTGAEARAYRDRPSISAPSGVPGPPYYVAIAPHIVRRSNGTEGLPPEQYEQAVIDANLAYANIEVVFYTLGEIDFIDSDAFYFNIDSISEIDALRTTNTVPDAINCYFTENLRTGPNTPICGISAFTFSSVQAIAMSNSCTATPTNHSTFAHEIGHYFDLFHTHETAFGDELVNGSNCADAGDLLCDTPADPTLTTGTVDSLTCEYTGDETDDNDDPYEPDTRQFLSYSRKHCRDRFTPEGEANALETLLSLRSNLISTAVGAGEFDAFRATGASSGAVTLASPRPNPASGAVELGFRMDAAGFLDFSIHDVRGARVCTIARGVHAAGEHVAQWDGLDSQGRETAPGIYFARIIADRGSAMQKIQRLR